MTPRLAPALGLAAACTMLTGIGVMAIGFGQGPQQPTSIAGVVDLKPAGTAAAVRRSSAAAEELLRTSRATRDSVTPVPPASVSTVPSPAATTNAAPPSSVNASSAGPSGPAASGPAAPATSPGAGTVGQPVGNDKAPMTSRLGSNSAGLAVLDAINRARTQHGLPALRWSDDLQLSARRHNQAMAAANTLSHQVDRELSLGQRETAAGVEWTYAAENIAWTTENSEQGALDIEARMLAETAPDDAHRRNILSTHVRLVGIDTYFDAVHGRLWFTEDFAG